MQFVDCVYKNITSIHTANDKSGERAGMICYIDTLAHKLVNKQEYYEYYLVVDPKSEQNLLDQFLYETECNIFDYFWFINYRISNSFVLYYTVYDIRSEDLVHS